MEDRKIIQLGLVILGLILFSIGIAAFIYGEHIPGIIAMITGSSIYVLVCYLHFFYSQEQYLPIEP